MKSEFFLFGCLQTYLKIVFMITVTHIEYSTCKTRNIIGAPKSSPKSSCYFFRSSPRSSRSKGWVRARCVASITVHTGTGTRYSTLINDRNPSLS